MGYSTTGRSLIVPQLLRVANDFAELRGIKLIDKLADQIFAHLLVLDDSESILLIQFHDETEDETGSGTSGAPLAR